MGHLFVQSRSARRAGSLVLAVLLLSLTGACHRKADNSQRFLARVDQLYDQYLTGDAAQARVSMLKIIQLHQTAALPEDGQAEGLWMAYARLYLLDKRTGSDAQAEADWVKTRYWYLRSEELRSPSEAVRRLNAFNESKCAQFVDEWDQHHSGGRGPAYVGAPAAKKQKG